MKAHALGLMYGMAGILAAGSNYAVITGAGLNVSPADLANARKEQEKNELQDKLNKGLKPYSQQGVTVYARNDKNGFRKLKAAILAKGLIYNGG